MEEAIGGKISDYLIKPVNPNQILLTVKRILEQRRIRSEKFAQSYLESFNDLSDRIKANPGWKEWIEIYQQLTRWNIDLESGEESLLQVLADQYQEANKMFGRFIESQYPQWLDLPPQKRPPLSVDIMADYVLPHLEKERPTLFFVIDCLRYDQWLVFENLLTDYYSIDTEFYYSILPTATPFSRNAIFAGLFPAEIQDMYPDLWVQDDDESSLNRYEQELLKKQLARKGVDTKPKYEKILNAEEGKKVTDRILNYTQSSLSTFVYNFIDTLVHSRSDSKILKEIAPDVPAFRSLTKTWFEHSSLNEIFKILAEEDVTIVVTSDHGAVRALRDTKVFGDRETSTSLRYKFGRNLNTDEDVTIKIEDPAEYKLPTPGIVNSYLIAKEDYYFVYPTNYHHYRNRYKDTFLHGGASLEEMILPVVTMRPKAFL